MGLAELLLCRGAMHPKLHLVKPARDTSLEDREVREVRYRYPAEEESWEVSCNGKEEQGGPTPTLHRSRAS